MSFFIVVLSTVANPCSSNPCLNNRMCMGRQSYYACQCDGSNIKGQCKSREFLMKCKSDKLLYELSV